MILYYFELADDWGRLEDRLLGEDGHYYIPDWAWEEDVSVRFMNSIGRQVTVAKAREYLASHGWVEISQERFNRLKALK